jgi:hypothetical protein
MNVLPVNYIGTVSVALTKDDSFPLKRELWLAVCFQNVQDPELAEIKVEQLPSSFFELLMCRGETRQALFKQLLIHMLCDNHLND